MRREIDGLVGLFEAGAITRRNLAEAIVGLFLASRAAAGPPERIAMAQPVVPARTLNHVTITASDVKRSRDFYGRLTGLPIRDEGPGFCEFRLENGFLGLYAPEAGQRPGFSHFCFGTAGYDAAAVLARVKAAMPEAKPHIEFGDQIYLDDPDGVEIQFADVGYKR